MTRFALTEQQQPDNWRWAIFGMDCDMLGAGSEPTQALAKSVAEQALESNQTRTPFDLEEGIF